ncbi:MAG: hypothetical protein A2X49_03285 [Lentisphaerae bacterium GWF2_52_8]|nr:MAG: hypothetical protein A2X49_03285 [Lentisphaerae bacterium GWF2_52_8]
MIFKSKFASKNRVLCALARQKPDRIPINYSANPGINAKLCTHFNAKTNEELLCSLGVDIRGAGAPYQGARLHPEIPERQVDPLWGIRTKWIEHGAGGYWDYCDFPLREASLEEIEQWPIPSPDDFDYGKLVEAARSKQQYAVHYGGPGLGDCINSTGMLRSMEEVLVDMITENPAGLRLMDRKIELQLEVARRSLEAARGLIDFLWIGEDLGTQNGPMVSLELFRSQIRPRLQKFVDLAKSFSLPVLIHSCGSSSWAFPDFIEMGIAGVDTLQPEAKDMSPRFLKENFGGRLAFHGGISTAEPLTNGNPEEVRKYCQESIGIMAEGGGYIFAPTHQIQDNTPLENALSMYEAAAEFCKT